jgi:hypothetical protein
MNARSRRPLTIVIAGSRSNVGKTTLGRALRRILAGAVLVKIGTGRPRPGRGMPPYPMGTPWPAIRRAHPGAACIIIESNTILRSFTPDLVIYLPGYGPAKPSAAPAPAPAHLVRGGRITCAGAWRLAGRLRVAPRVFGRILDAAGVKLAACAFGVF